LHGVNKLDVKSCELEPILYDVPNRALVSSVGELTSPATRPAASADRSLSFRTSQTSTRASQY